MHQFIIRGDDGSKFEFAMSLCLHTDQTIKSVSPLMVMQKGSEVQSKQSLSE